MDEDAINAIASVIIAISSILALIIAVCHFDLKIDKKIKEISALGGSCVNIKAFTPESSLENVVVGK